MLIPFDDTEYKEYTRGRRYRTHHLMFDCDQATIDLAIEHNLDPELIEYCEETMDSVDLKDIVIHRNLQKQVLKVSGYRDKSINKKNNTKVHRGDKVGATLKQILS